MVHYFVSIHASVKDATDHIGYQPIYIKVSIHASVKDATGETRELRFIYQVSIHASVKDATETKNIKVDTSKFQSTHL